MYIPVHYRMVFCFLQAVLTNQERTLGVNVLSCFLVLENCLFVCLFVCFFAKKNLPNRNKRQVFYRKFLAKTVAALEAKIQFKCLVLK